MISVVMFFWTKMTLGSGLFDFSRPEHGEEKVVEEAVLIRAHVFEAKTGFRFDWQWMDKSFVCLLPDLSNADNGNEKYVKAEYSAEDKKIIFSILLIEKMAKRHGGTPLYKLSAESVADDEYFSIAADHELGHLLADQFSRRYTGRPSYLVADLEKESDEDWWGTKIVSEGIAMFFECSLHNPSEYWVSKWSLPLSLKNRRRNYSDDQIEYDGGHWLIYDILCQHGEDGLKWLVLNPFHTTDDLRQCALRYRDRALQELSNQCASQNLSKK